MVGVAQLVERWLVVPDVAGSSPVIHPNLGFDTRLASRGGTQPTEELESSTLDEVSAPWVLIVWNDPINLMTYVVYVFQSYFGYSEPEAERLMLLVHHEGKAVVAKGAREEIERHTEAMHEYGLQASMVRADA